MCPQTHLKSRQGKLMIGDRVTNNLRLPQAEASLESQGFNLNFLVE